jgi:hypothetical protein
VPGAALGNEGGLRLEALPARGSGGGITEDPGLKDEPGESTELRSCRTLDTPSACWGVFSPVRRKGR